MQKITLVSSTEGTSKIKIRCLNFSKEKRKFVEERAIARDLFMPQMGWGGAGWPFVYVRGEEEDIKKFFNDLKEYFFLNPFYDKNWI